MYVLVLNFKILKNFLFLFIFIVLFLIFIYFLFYLFIYLFSVCVRALWCNSPNQA